MYTIWAKVCGHIAPYYTYEGLSESFKHTNVRMSFCVEALRLQEIRPSQTTSSMTVSLHSEWDPLTHHLPRLFWNNSVVHREPWPQLHWSNLGWIVMAAGYQAFSHIRQSTYFWPYSVSYNTNVFSNFFSWSMHFCDILHPHFIHR